MYVLSIHNQCDWNCLLFICSISTIKLFISNSHSMSTCLVSLLHSQQHLLPINFIIIKSTTSQRHNLFCITNGNSALMFKLWLILRYALSSKQDQLFVIRTAIKIPTWLLQKHRETQWIVTPYKHVEPPKAKKPEATKSHKL